MAPWVAELTVLPSLVDSQQREMVTFWLEKLSLLLVCLSLLLSWSIEDVLQASTKLVQHCTAKLSLWCCYKGHADTLDAARLAPQLCILM